ncbi:HPr family phosphocarrier protein [Howardella ureilytica]
MDKTVLVSGMGEYKNPISQLVQTACKYDSHINIESGNKSINAKSLLGVMALGLKDGMEVNIKVEGNDADDALNAIADFLTA